MTVADGVYLLCALTCLACALLLARAYRRTRARLLLWSSLCFACLCLNNILLFVDLSLAPTVDLLLVRQIPALVGVALLMYGLIWEGTEG